MNIYEKCPVLESDRFIIRLFQDIISTLEDDIGNNFSNEQLLSW